MFLLGQSQTPGSHRAVGTQIDLGQFSDRFLLDSALVHDLGPVGLLNQRPVGLETARKALQELLIHGLGVGLRTLEDNLRDPAQQRQVPPTRG